MTWNIAFSNETLSILSVRWAPDNEHILMLNECALQTTVWSICSKKIVTLPGIRDIWRYCSFSHDGKWFAFLHRMAVNSPYQQDYVSIVSARNWECVCTFPLRTTQAISVSVGSLCCLDRVDSRRPLPVDRRPPCPQPPSPVQSRWGGVLLPLSCTVLPLLLSRAVPPSVL